MNELNEKQINDLYKTLGEAIDSPNRLIFIVYSDGTNFKGVDHLQGEKGTTLSMKNALMDSQLSFVR